jgi:ribose 5-phosphate isomerase A
VSNPIALEQQLNNIVGVVCNGIFAANQADILLKANNSGVETILR